MDTVTYAPGTIPHTLLKEIYSARAHQFIHRLQWDLCIEKCGGEIDQYDDTHAYYVVVKDRGQHILSCRIRPAISGTMVEECFADSFPVAKSFISGHRRMLWEVTRFCKSPQVSTAQSAAALKAMSFELDGFRDHVGATGFIAVVYPHFPRFLQRLGARFFCLADGIISCEKAQLICVTHSVDFRKKMIPDAEFELQSRLGISFAHGMAA